MKKSLFYIISAVFSLSAATASAQVDLDDPANAEFRDEVEDAFSRTEQQGQQPNQPVMQTMPQQQPNPLQPSTPNTIGNFPTGTPGQPVQPGYSGNTGYMADDDCPAENRVV